MEKLRLQFEDIPPHDTYVIRIGEAGAVLPNAFEREIGSRVLSATTRWLFAVILENDNGKWLLFVPDKKDHNLSNAKSAMKTLLTKTGLPISLVGAMKYLDLDALIEFGLFRSKSDVKTYFAKKQKDGPLNVKNINFEAEQPDCAFEDYTHKLEIGIIDLSDHHRYLHMLKHVPASEEIEPIGWTRPFDENCPDVKPAAWEPKVEQGSGLESRMKALALEDEAADSGRKISVPASKGRRTHEDLETQTVEGPKVRVLLGPLAVPGYDGTLYIRKAKASKEYGEEEWIETLKTAVEEKGAPAILEEMYDTAIELMDQGALPEVERDPNPDNKKSLAVHRCRKARDFLDKTLSTHAKYTGAHGAAHTWEALSNKEFKQACHNIARKHGTKESRAKGDKCTHCEKPAHACTHYLVLGEEWIWKPISELVDEKAKDVVKFCSRRCEQKWQEVLICPDCNTYEYTISTGAQSYPSPADLMDMTAQYVRRQAQAQAQAQVERQKVKNTEESALYWAEFQRRLSRGEKPPPPPEIVQERPIKMWGREPRRVKVATCVTCSATMLPRNPNTPHLRSDVIKCLA